MIFYLLYQFELPDCVRYFGDFVTPGFVITWFCPILYSNFGLAEELYWDSSAGNNFSYLAGHVSFQVFILVGHITNLVGH